MTLIESARKTLARAVFGSQVKQINYLTETMQRLPAAFQSPEFLIKNLKEVDPQLLEVLLRLQQSAYTYPEATSEAARIATVQESRYMYTYDVITQYIIDLWTDYGFGSKLEVKSKDPAAQKLLDAFFLSETNQYILGQREISDQSTQLLKDGEFFYVFYVSKQSDIPPTIRIIPTEQIKEIITDPDDASVPIFYKREWTSKIGSSVTTLYYRDWRVNEKDQVIIDKIIKVTPEINDQLAVKKSKDAAAENAKVAGHTPDLQEVEKFATDVFVMHIAHRKAGGRGWPLMTAGIPWSKAYKNFMQDRAAVARAAAMFFDKVKIKGGSIAVNDIMGRLTSSLTTGTGNTETNPPSVAGSTWGENEALERTRFPMGTGASDAREDGAAMLRQVGLGGHVFPHYLGAGEAFRLATATAMEQPILRTFNRYRRFWDSVWQDVATVIFNASDVVVKDKSIIVVSDPLIQMDVEQIASFTTAVTDLYDRQAVEPDQMSMIADAIIGIGLKAIGVSDAGTIMEPDKAAKEIIYKSRRSTVSELPSEKKFHKAFREALDKIDDGD